MELLKYNGRGYVAENTQAAESRIRDTDMAREMVKASLKNILALILQKNLLPRLCFLDVKKSTRPYRQGLTA